MTAKNNTKNELKYQSNPPTNDLMGRWGNPTRTDNADSQHITLMVAKSNQTEIYLNGKDADEISRLLEKTLQEIIEDYRAFEIPILWDMVLEQLHETHYTTSTCTFRYSEICDKLGLKQSHADRIKEGFHAAATILRHTTMNFHIKSTIYDKNVLISVSRPKFENGSPNPTLELEVNPALLLVLKECKSVIARDIALYSVSKRYRASYVLGRHIEDQAKRKQIANNVRLSVASIMDYLKYLVPDHLLGDRNHSKRMEWLEKQIIEMAKVKFIKWDKTKDWTNRPTCLSDESKSIITFRFELEHPPLKPRLASK